jgi:formylglycine-generating enzyme required for sulfatase activity
MAAGIVAQPDAFVQAVLEVNPALAGRCLSDGAANVDQETEERIRQALLADLGTAGLHRRARLQAGRVLGAVGDPHLEPVEVGDVKVILPDLVEVPGGTATLGSAEAEAFDNEQPVHQVKIAPFYLARYPVTNAEYRCFIEAGGYDTEPYWTPTGWQWRQGALEESGPIEEWLRIRQAVLQDPNLPDKLFKEGRLTPDARDSWQAIAKMSEAELRQKLSKYYAPQPHQQPYYWDDPTYNAPNQPVVGVTWYEAMAYCAWLNERISQWAKGQKANGESDVFETGVIAELQSKIVNRKPVLPVLNEVEGSQGSPERSRRVEGSKMEARLPTEAEWEWAAGGPQHTPYPCLSLPISEVSKKGPRDLT